MQAQLIGATPTSSVMAVIGQFDPFTHLHAALMRQLSAEARLQGKSPVAILFEPDIRAVLYGPHRWQAYDDAAIKRYLIVTAGVDTVLQIACDRADLHSGAREVFDLVCGMVHLSDLWLGTHQRLGSGDPGSVETTQQEADRRGVQVTRLPPVEILPHMNEVRRLMSQGKVVAASLQLGRHPQRMRTPIIEVGWAPGNYTVLGHREDGRTVSLEVTLCQAPNRMSTAPWPDSSFHKVTFISGPADTGSGAVAAD
jgi:FAD synthase